MKTRSSSLFERRKLSLSFLMPSHSPERCYQDTPSEGRLRSLLWWVVYYVLFRPTPHFCLGSYRIALLRLFGAKIGAGSKVAPSCRVSAPWNLTLGNYACLAGGVDCYCVASVTLDDYATVSQRTYLCSASHRTGSLSRPLFSMPIHIQTQAWICAEAFVGPGVRVGEGSVVGARAVVVRDVPAWVIVAGNPARIVKERILDREPSPPPHANDASAERSERGQFRSVRRPALWESLPRRGHPY